MKKIINLISSISIASSFLNSPLYAKTDLGYHVDSETGKYGYSIITSENKEPDKFNKNNWIRSRQRKIPCGSPNVVGIQSTSSSTLVATNPQPIPNFSSCANKINLV